MVLIFFLARMGRPDIVCSVNKLARAVMKWTKACDKRSARLISYIHHTCDFRQYWYVGNIGQHCRLGLCFSRYLNSGFFFLKKKNIRSGLFQDADFAGDLEVNIWRNSMHFRKPNVRANKLDVQETDFCFTQFYGS